MPRSSSFVILTAVAVLLASFATSPVWSLPGSHRSNAGPVAHIDKDKVFEVGSPAPSKETLSKCVDMAAKKLGIDMNMKSDVRLLDDILENDMHLKDMPGIQSLFKTDLVAEQPLLPMLEQVRKGITAVHPAIGATLCLALKDPSTAGIFSSPNAAVIKRTIHHMFLLEKLVDKMANDRNFMKEVSDHLRDKSQAMTPHHSFLGRIWDIFKASGLFGVAKTYSVENAMNNYVILREKGNITPEEAERRKESLTLNILEATVADFAHGYFPNAKVGNRLAWDHPSSIDIVGENRAIQYVNRMEYAQLYETWNLAFITGNLEFPNLLYPKLLIPSVVTADANGYMYKRVLALNVSIYFYLMAFMEKKTPINIAGKEKLATLWGQVNLKYADFQPPKPQ